MSSVSSSLKRERYSTVDPLASLSDWLTCLMRMLIEMKSPRDPNVGANDMMPTRY